MKKVRHEGRTCRRAHNPIENGYTSFFGAQLSQVTSLHTTGCDKKNCQKRQQML
jgi:hypothetical protein